MLAVLLVLARAVAGIITRRWLEVRGRMTRPLLAIAVVVVAVLQVRRQRHASMLAG